MRFSSRAKKAAELLKSEDENTKSFYANLIEKEE
jgi:hypothetical protein